jgi:SAM-dependent methyltransferase
MQEMHPLPRENVFGHTKKLCLLRESCAALRAARGTLRILDVGCGSGYAVTRYLGETQDEVLGIDLFEPNIEYANRNFAREGLSFECRTAESLVSSLRTFDVIVLADVLEHLDDPAGVLAECHRLLSPGGLLLVTVPNGYGPFEIESAIARLRWIGPALLTLTAYAVAFLNKYGPLRGKWTEALSEIPEGLPYNAESGHVNFFSAASLGRLLDAAGFAVLARTNLSLVCGPFTNFIFAASRAFCARNVSFAERMPAWSVSSWLWKCTDATQVRASSGP